ncbi:hypothetical protein BD779DRAFT_1786648, partial [Infundibulicybe gibba]
MAPTPTNHTFDDTLGAIFIGFSLSCVAFGVLTSQTFTYFKRYPSDRPAYKLLVSSIWLLELLHQVFIGHALYYYTITNFLTPSVLAGSIIWTLVLQLILGAVVGTVVKACFAMRVWRCKFRNIFSRSPFEGGHDSQQALHPDHSSYCSTHIWATRRFTRFELNGLQYAPRLKLLATLSLAGGVLTDVVTAAALCYYLRKLRTGHKQYLIDSSHLKQSNLLDSSDSLVNTLTRYAVNTGALTSAVSLCTLILYNVRPSAFYFMGSYFVLSKLYAISFLCTLNTRTIIRGRGTDQEDQSTRGNPLFVM